MPGSRIPALTAIAGASTANDDNLVIFDTSTDTTKRILRSQLAVGLVGDLPYTPAGFIAATTVPTAIAEIASDVAASSGSSLVGYLPAGTGAVATTVQTQLRLTVFSSNFSDLTTIVNAIGATPTNLIVNSSITFANDLTIPSNIWMSVQGAGLITVPSGKRLYINGPFSAPRLQKCFNSSLLVTTLTANVQANALNVTVASANVLAAGHVIIGTGILSGQIIQATYGNTGIGQYSLNNINGAVASTSMTATGPSVIFGSGVVEQVYPQWWGAIADTNVTDNGIALSQAVYSMPWGGKVKIPSGNYMVTTSNIVLHPNITIEGDGISDNGTGAPPNAFSVPTYLWQNTASAYIFIINGLCSHVRVRDLGLGTLSSPGGGNLTADANKKLIGFIGHAGQNVFSPMIDNVMFFNAQQAINIVDTYANVGDGLITYTYGYPLTAIAANGNLNSTTLGQAYQITTVGSTNWAAITATVISGTLGTLGCVFLANSTVATGTGQVAPMVFTPYAMTTANAVAATTILPSSTSGQAYQIVTVGTTNWAAITGVVLQGTLGTIGCVFLANATAATGTGTINTFTTYYDWAVNPASISNCTFFANLYAITVTTTNLDACAIRDCVFFVSANGDAIRLIRSGLMKLDNSFCISAVQPASSTNFIHILSSGLGASVDSITLNGCQTESTSNFIYVDSVSQHQVAPIITIGNCIFQLGAQIYLAATCELESYGCEALAYTYIDASGIRHHSYSDRYGTGFNAQILSGDTNSLYTYIPGNSPSNILTGPIFGGVKTGYATSIPTSGSAAVGGWRVGDRVLNSVPTVGQPKAWVCTVAGTASPTFVSEGNL